MSTPEFLPRALYDRFHLEVLATTDSPLDSLADHEAIRESRWKARIIPTFRPDPVVDPDFDGFAGNVAKLGEQTGEDTAKWAGYFKALAYRTRTDFANSAAQQLTTDTQRRKPRTSRRRVLLRYLVGSSRELITPSEKELFRAQMLTEMARMSLEDGLVMQIHPGSMRNHNRKLFEAIWARYGRGYPNAARTMWTRCARCSIEFGNERRPHDHSFHAGRIDLQPRTGPARRTLSMLAAWSAVVVSRQPGRNDALSRARDGDCGFYNTVGFNDDTRAFLSIPARHDMARRMDCASSRSLWPSTDWKRTRRAKIARELAYRLVKKAYRL